MDALRVELTVHDLQSRDRELDSAVQIAQVHARRTGEGILVTQESYSRYTVATSPEVPYGLIRERRASAQPTVEAEKLEDNLL